MASGKKGTDGEHSYKMANCIIYDVGRAVVHLDRHYIHIIITSDITIMYMSSAVSHSLKLCLKHRCL